MVAILELHVVLAAQEIVTFALPVPEEGETVHQLWLLETVHAQVPDDRVSVEEPAVAGAEKLVGENDSTQPACVTVTLTGLSPGTVTVMVACLLLQVVLAV